MDVMSVTGPVSASDLGVILPHEHVFADLVREYRGNGLLNDEHLARAELEGFRAAGGSTLVDLTLDEIGRDPAALRRAAEATGVTIVMGCGHYRDPYLNRDWFDRHTVDEIAEEIVRDIEEGVRGTGVRAGIIGEIGADRAYISAAEERSFRAAARAHLRTGLTVSTHAARWPVGTEQLRLLGEEGVDPRRAVDYVLALARAGFLAQVLLSHDVFLRGHLRADGGCGYGFLLTEFMPMLTAAGLDEQEAASLVTANPRAALTGEAAALPNRGNNLVRATRSVDQIATSLLIF